MKEMGAAVKAEVRQMNRQTGRIQTSALLCTWNKISLEVIRC